MSDEHAVFIDNKAESFSFDLKVLNHLLNLVHHCVHSQDIRRVGKLPADCDDDTSRLCVHIRGNNRYIPMLRDSGFIPVPFDRIISFRRLPIQPVQILAHNIAVDSGGVFVKLLFLLLRFFNNIIVYLFCGSAVVYHMVYCIRCNPQHAL